MRQLPITVIIAFMLPLWGCSPKELVRERYIYIVKHEVPKNPSFVVLPQDQYSLETDFAERVEGVLIGSGHRVVNRPARKLVETERSTASGSSGVGGIASGAESNAAQARVTETYYALEDIDANYIVFTRARVGRVRLTETAEEAQARHDGPIDPANPRFFRDEDYDVARIRIIHRLSGEVVSNFELTLDSRASENLREALANVVESEI